MRNKLITFLFFFLILALWQVIFSFKIISPAILASPIEVLEVFPSFIAEFWYHIISTLLKSSLAFILSVPIGLLLGYTIFHSAIFRYPSELFLDFVRSIPSTALIPFFMIIFGIGESTKVAIGVYSSSLIICLSTILGLKSRNKTRLHISKMIGFSPIKRFLYIDIPESISQIFVGLRAGVSLALILVIVSEMFIGSNQGLGKIINDMYYSDAVPKLYCCLLITGFIGYFYNFVLIQLEKKIVHWTGL